MAVERTREELKGLLLRMMQGNPVYIDSWMIEMESFLESTTKERESRLSKEFDATVEAGEAWVKTAMDRQKEIEALRVSLASMAEEKNRCQKEANNLNRELESVNRSAAEDRRVAELFRAHLDDSAQDAESDNEWEGEARQRTWNQLDADNEQQEAEIHRLAGKRL